MSPSRTSCSNFPAYVLLLMAVAALPASAETVLVYATNSAGDNVHVIDPATNKVVQVIRGVEAVHGVGFSPDGKRVYLSNEADDTLDVVDQKSGRILKKIHLSGRPNNLAVTTDGGRVVVALTKPFGLDIIDTTKLALKKMIPMNGRMHNTYVTPDGKYAVSGSVRHRFLNVVDLATEETAWEIKFDGGVRPMTFEVNPDGSTRRVFVQLSNLDGFAIVDFAERREIARIKFPDEPKGHGVAEGRIGAGVYAHGIGRTPCSFIPFPTSGCSVTPPCLISGCRGASRSGRYRTGSPSRPTARPYTLVTPPSTR
jgi:YVTN family beta-propeller protein